MKMLKLAFLLLTVSSTQLIASVSDANKFAKDFPLIFWYTMELWKVEARGTDTGFSSEEYPKQVECKVVELVELSSGKETWKFRYNWIGEDIEEDEGWEFVFTLKDDKWRADTGVRLSDSGNLDLYKSDFFSRTMKPQMNKSLELYNQNKLLDEIEKFEKSK